MYIQTDRLASRRRYTEDRNCLPCSLMRPHCPRASLGDQTPQDRAHEKAQLACAWLAIVGHSTEKILLDVLQVQARGICARLQRAGLIRRVSVPMSAAAVWALTASGLRLAELALGRRVAYLTHPERLTLSRLTHEMAVQYEAVARLRTNLQVLRQLRADRELRAIGAATRPDLLARYVDDHGVERTVCIEVEITSKGDRELRTKMAAILHMLTPSTLWLWCITEGRTTCERYAQTWASVVDTCGDGFGMDRPQLHRACRFELAQAAGSLNPAWRGLP